MKKEKKPLITCSLIRDSNVIFAEFSNNLQVDLAKAKEIVDTRLALTGNKEHYIIFDLSNVRHVSSDAKEFMQRPDEGLKNILGAAFIASNPVSALIANIFIKTPKDFQSKFFSGKEEAFEWIMELRQKSSSNTIIIR